MIPFCKPRYRAGILATVIACGCSTVLGLDPIYRQGSDGGLSEDPCSISGGRLVGSACLGPQMEVASYWNHTCAKTQDGSVWCWGNNQWGQIGNGEIGAPVFSPTKVLEIGPGTPLGAVKTIAVGYANTCALLENGGRIACWGNNSIGQVDYAAFLLHPFDSSAAIPNPTIIANLENATRITVGWVYMCAEVDKQILCWGNNLFGGCGQDCSTNVTVAAPTPIQFPPNFPLQAEHLKLVAAKWHTCLLVADARAPLWCWGFDGGDQLGMQLSDVDSGNTCSPPPGFASAVSDGSDLTTSSAIATGVFQPIPVLGVTNFGIIADVAVGCAHTCASTLDGKVLCWGNNNRGQLGIGTDLSTLGPCLVNQNCPVATPTPVVDQGGVRLSGFGTLAAGSGGHVCATQWAASKCWGGNDSGELGTGVPSFGDFSSAQTTIFPETTRQIAVGDNHTCVLDISAEPDILCVGDGHEGQTGRGPGDNSATWELRPVKWQ